MIRSLLTCLILCSSQLLAQQKYALELIHALDEINLPEKEPIYDVYRDLDNNLWLCAAHGVYRYTGYTNSKYLMHDGLGDNLNFGCFEDKQNRIWFRSYNGKMSYYKSGKIYNRNNDSLCRLLDFNSIITGISGIGNKIAFASQADGIKILDGSKVKAIAIKIVKQIYWTDERHLKILTHEGVYNYDLKNDNFTLVTSLQWGEKYVCARSDNSRVILAYGSEAYEYRNNKLCVLFSAPYPEHEIIYTEKYNDSIYLFGTRKGILIFNINTGMYQIKDFGYPVSCIKKDRNGEIWISISEHGVFRLKKLEDLNIKIKEISNVSCLFKDSYNRVWAGTYQGNIIRVNADGSMKIFDPSIFGIRKDKTTQILEMPNHDIVVLNKLFIAKIINDQLKFIRNVGGNEAYIDEKSKDIWIRSIAMSKLNLDDKLKEHPLLHIIDKKFNALHYYDGKLYAATNDWLGWIHRDSFYSVFNFDEIITDICDKYVLTGIGHIYEISGGQVKKLAFEPPARASCEKFILKDNKLFICTDKGLFVYNLSDMKTFYASSFRSLVIQDIVVDKKFAYLGTANALYKVPIGFLSSHDYTDDVHFSFQRVRTSKRQYKIKSHLKIPYEESELMLDFDVKSFFRQPGFYHKTDDKDWIKTKNFYITLNLAPGKHTIYVYARTDESPKKSLSHIIHIEILPPFWQQWWFKIATVLFLSLTLFILYKFWTYRLKRKFKIIQEAEQKRYEKLEMEKNIIQLEQKALRMQMNPHFIFNAINTIKGFYAEKNERDGSRYINNFSKLLRNILESESFISPLEKEIEIASSYLKMMQVRYPELDFEINFRDMDAKTIGIPGMMIQPFVENAILHGIRPKGGKGTVNINIIAIDELSLKVDILDDGVGLGISSSEHISKSYQITEERLKAFNRGFPYKLTLENNRFSTGVIVTIITRFEQLSK